jgi:membrane protease YdiL (CAAX protease family)
MLDCEELGHEPETAPQGDSRGRVVAAVALLLIAALGAAFTVAFNSTVGRNEMRDYQARMDFFQGRVVMGFSYYLDAMQGAPGPRSQAAGDFAHLGALSAASYFQKAARGFKDPGERTAAAASAAALYTHAGENLRALRALQATMDSGRRDVLSLLARLYANQRPTPEWLRSEALAWIPRHAPAHLLIESQVAQALGRTQRVAELRRRMHDAGAVVAGRAAVLMFGVGALALLGVVLLALGGLRRSGFGPYRGLPQHPWGLWAGLELVGAWLVLYGALSIFGAAAIIWGTAGFAAGILAAYGLASVIVLVWFAASVAPKGTGLRTAGWTRLPPRQVILNGIGAYAAAVPVAVLAALLAQRFLPTPPPNPLVAEMTRAHGWAARALLVVLLCVAAPVVEETVFRGGLYGGLRKRWSLPVAALVAAAIFAAVHLNLASLVPVMALGISLCVVYERTGSLLPGMLAHGLFNLVSVIAIFAFS